MRRTLYFLCLCVVSQLGSSTGSSPSPPISPGQVSVSRSELESAFTLNLCCQRTDCTLTFDGINFSKAEVLDSYSECCESTNCILN